MRGNGALIAQRSETVVLGTHVARLLRYRYNVLVRHARSPIRSVPPSILERLYDF
jgi:hypothetical protein